MKKKGFTLIELLAVIIILAIILVIAVPKILEVIENARMKSYKESVELMVHTAKLQYQTQEIQGTAPEIPTDGIIYKYGKSENDTIQTNIDEVGLLNFKGDKPSAGTITLTLNKKVIVDQLVSKNEKWCAKKTETGEVEVGKVGDKGYNCAVDSSQEASVDDEPCVLATETKDGKEYYYIDSVEDMYAFSDSVNSGNTYEGKIVKLRTNLNFSNYTSDKKTKVCKDNDNENGFTPIGIYYSKPFSGTFEGNIKTISNLTINRPNQDYVGIFGYTDEGEIYGLNLDNVKVTGHSYVGTLVGEYSSWHKIKIHDITVKNSEVNSSYIRYGGVVGYTGDGSIQNVLVKSVKLSGYDTTESGPIVGSGGATNCVVENANIRGTTTSLTQKGDISYYQKSGMDTWINGDDGNDTPGYYFDYENASSNNIVLKSVEKDPIPTNVSSTFTKEGDFYLINNTNDWKNFSAFKDSTEHFKLGSDLDFSNKHYYIIDSIYQGFSGVFDGGAHTIKNVNLNMPGMTYVGLFSQIDDGTIYGLNLENIKVSSAGYAGTLAGSYSPWYKSIEEISVNNCEVNGTNIRYGGLVGYVSDQGYVKNILIKNVSITGYDTSESGPIVGNYRWEVQNYIIENANVRGTTQTTLESPSNKDDLSYYSGKVETRLDNDSNNTGYSFGYDTNKQGIFVIPRSQNEGWELINSKTPLTSQKWIYWNNDGTRIQSDFRTLKDFSGNDQKYYFENGVAVVGLKVIDGYTYFFSTSDLYPENGFVDANMVHDQTVMINAVPYTFGSDGKCTNCN